MNWLDEGALYSQIPFFLREDLGRGDITTQSVVTRNTRAKARFIAHETMIVAGLEAAEEVFLTLDAQQQLEAFVSDGEEIEAGKVIARMSGFADVFLAGERVALTLIQHLSGVATITNRFVKAIEGTAAKIVDTRQTTPGMRMLEKYAVQLGGGLHHRFGLDDSVVIRSNHVLSAGGISTAVKNAKEKLGNVHKIQVQVTNEPELQDALTEGADMLLFEGLAANDVARLTTLARQSNPKISVECVGDISLENVREYADSGVDMIGIPALTSSVRSLSISFQIQPS